MAFARDVYAATAAQTDFTITFAYQAEEDVLVYVNGSLLTAVTDYSFPVSTTIRLVVASTNGDHVVIQRKTSQSSRDVDFTPGALTEADLDNSAIQAFYMAQEALDISGTKLGLVSTTGAEWDGQSKRITLVSDPTGDQDASTKSYVDTSVLGLAPATPLSVANGGTASSTAANARTALGLYSTTEIDNKDTAAVAAALAFVDDLSGVSDSSTALDNLGAGTTGKAIFADTTAAAVRTEIGAQEHVMTTQGDMVRGGASGAAERVAIGAVDTILTSDGTDAAFAAPAANMVWDTPITVSGTTVAFTGIPAWARRVTIFFTGVSISGTDDIDIQIGDSGGLETSGYLSVSNVVISGSTTTGIVSTAGFALRAQSAANLFTGSYVLTLMDDAGSTWVGSSVGYVHAGVNTQISAGSKTLSGVLDRITLILTGSDTWDAGDINIMYER